MVRPGLCVFLLFGAYGWGATVNDLAETVLALLRTGQSDSRVAKAIHKLTLTEMLDDRTIEELESAGAGPKALEELAKVQAASLKLPPAAALPEALRPPPAPSAEEQQQVLDATRKSALAYSHSLPDFICTEVVRRYENLSNSDLWNLKDTLTVQLTYFQEKENYKLVRLNNRRTSLTYRAVGGALSEGEFGSLLNLLFEPEAGADFRWDHWTTLRKRPAHVFAFRVSVKRSQYHIDVRLQDGPLETAIVGQHGFVYVDRDTGMVLKIIADADSFPESFPVRRATGIVDYDFVGVGGRVYLLPIHAVTRMDTGGIQTRNDLSFQEYRKFTGEATITYEVPEKGKQD